MKYKCLFLLLMVVTMFTQVKGNYVMPVANDLSLHLVTERRDATIYQPPFGTNVRLVGWSDNSHYMFTRASATLIPNFSYSPYAMCDGKVMKIQGYYTDYDYTPAVTYAYLKVTIGTTTYYMYWPLYLDASSGGITNYINFLQPA